MARNSQESKDRYKTAVRALKIAIEALETYSQNISEVQCTHCKKFKSERSRFYAQVTLKKIENLLKLVNEKYAEGGVIH